MDKINENVQRLLEKRYLLRDNKGNLIEHSWDDISKRIANNIAQAEKDEYIDYYASIFYTKIKNMEFIPSSPCIFNAGTTSQSLSSCFVVDIEDNIEGIFQTVAECAKIFQMAGGAGFSMRKIRPRGALCKSSGSTASGVISFMHIFDEVVNRVKQGNKRNGALKIDLPCDHPEILDFIHCKDDITQLNNMNISVSITDEFIKAVENDEKWDLKFNGVVYQTINAVDLWNEIMYCAWKSAEPGISYQTNMNNGNMNPHLNLEVYGNPCFTGDMRLLTTDGYKDFESLSGNNVYLINNNGAISSGKVWCSGEKEVVELKLSNGFCIKCTPNHVFMLSNGEKCEAQYTLNKELLAYEGNCQTVISINMIGKQKVYDFNEPINHWGVVEGLVVSNCHEFVNIPYSSCNLLSINLIKVFIDSKINWDLLQENIEIAFRFLDNMITMNRLPLKKIDEITKLIRPIGLGTMGFAQLLYLLGIPYDSEECLKFIDKLYGRINKIALNYNQSLAEERGVYPAWEGSKWEEQNLKVRCSSMTSIAPNGSIAFIANTTGGIEPQYALVYTRRDKENDEYVIVDSVFEQYLKDHNLFTKDVIDRIINNNGSIQGLNDIFSKEIQRVFVVANDISPEWHVKVLAQVQKYVSLSISKTINMPNNATAKEVGDVYLMASKLGIKGVTVYRDGCRNNQILSTGNKDKIDFTQDFILPSETLKYANAKRFKVNSGCGSFWLFLCYDDDGNLREIFSQSSTSGGCAGMTEALSRMTSLALKSNIHPDMIIDQLKSVRCPVSMMKKKEKNLDSKSCADAIGNAIKDFIQNDELKIISIDKRDNVINKQIFIKESEECAECGEKLTMSQGCVICQNCGFSKCN